MLFSPPLNQQVVVFDLLLPSVRVATCLQAHRAVPGPGRPGRPLAPRQQVSGGVRGWAAAQVCKEDPSLCLQTAEAG